MTRARASALLLLGALAAFATLDSRAQVLRYRAEHVFTLPEEMSKAMLAFGAPKDWRFFPRHTRHIDGDGDGKPDFIAIALGARTGYGAQIRYRLRHVPGAEGPGLGEWYWAVITGPGRERLFERFNP